jgi:hypothetical protein
VGSAKADHADAVRRLTRHTFQKIVQRVLMREFGGRFCTPRSPNMSELITVRPTIVAAKPLPWNGDMAWPAFDRDSITDLRHDFRHEPVHFACLALGMSLVGG